MPGVSDSNRVASTRGVPTKGGKATEPQSLRGEIALAEDRRKGKPGEARAPRGEVLSPPGQKNEAD